jgi:hypothetical protein
VPRERITKDTRSFAIHNRRVHFGTENLS